LNVTEYDSTEAHLATCETCRTEMQALQGLFAALGEVTDAPAPNLASSVLARVRPRRGFATLHWLIPAFQGAAAIALLAWSWTRLAGYWAIVTDTLPPKTLDETWKQVGKWAIAQWTALNTLPSAVWSNVQGWLARLTQPSGPGFPLPQLVVVGTIIGILWLACNVVLLRRSLLNGHKIQS